MVLGWGVTAIIFGLLTAAMFATSTLASSRAVRLISLPSVLAGGMLIGLVLTIPGAIAEGVPPGFTGANIIWFALAGIGNVGGLLLVYGALRVGKVGVVAPIAATEGAIAAVLAAIVGESIAPIAAFILIAIVAGIVLSAMAPDPAPLEQERPLRAALLATASSLFFAMGLFSTGHLSDQLPTSWLLLPPRLIGVLAIAIPIIIVGRMQMTRRALPFVAAVGVSEVLGNATFTVAARDSIAIASVMASQFATISAIMAFLLFKERLGRVQVAGVALLVVSITALTIVQSAFS